MRLNPDPIKKKFTDKRVRELVETGSKFYSFLSEIDKIKHEEARSTSKLKHSLTFLDERLLRSKKLVKKKLRDTIKYFYS